MISNYCSVTRFRRPQYGFTLVELLVVIAILAVLMSILVPILSRARDSAKEVLCMVNVRELQRATNLYFQDNKKCFPYEWDDLYLARLTKYSGDVDSIRNCPSTILDENRTWTGWWDGIGSAHVGWMWAYGSENEFGGYTINGSFYSGYEYDTMSKIDVVGAEYVPVFADGIWVDSWPGNGEIVPADFDLNGDYNYGGAMSRFLTNRHRDTTNIAFMDGHVSKVKLCELWSLKWYPDFEIEFHKLREDGSEIYP